VKVIVSLSLLFYFVAGLFSMCRAQVISPKAAEAVESKSPEDSGKKPGEAMPQTRLEEMVVTATAIPTPSKELPVSVEVISRKEIGESHSNDLAQLLIEKLPEHFQQYPGALTSVTIRGQRSNTVGTDIKGHVLVLIDGHRSGTGNIAVIPLENVERVEVVRGPGSVVYGAAAMGGVVNVITRKGSGTPSGGVAMESGSWDYLKGSAQASGGLLDDKLGFSLTGRGLFQNSDYKTGAGQLYPNTQYNDEAYSLSLRATPDPNHQFFAVANYFRGWDIGNPGPTYSPDPDDFTNILRRYCSLAYDGSHPENGLNWHLSYYNVLDQSDFNDPSAAWGYSSTTTDTTTQGVRGNFSLPTFSIGRLLMGLEWDGIKQDTATTPVGYNWSPNAQYNNYAFLAEETVNWDKLSFLAGLRYDLWQENIEPTEGLSVVSNSESFSHVSWRTGAKYWLFDWLAGRAAVGTGFRAPSADELAGRYTHGSYTRIVGNPGLTPETSLTYEFGLDAEYAGFTGGLGWFHTSEDDRITAGFPACVDGDCTWTTYRNVGAAVLSALEANVSYRQPFSFLDLSATLRPFANLSYYTQRELQDPLYIKVLKSDTVPYVPLWNVTGGIELNVNKTVSLTFSGVFNGPQQEENWDYLSPTYTQAIDMGGFAVFSARLTVTPVKYFKCFVGFENLTNLDYAFVNGYPMPGRTVRGGLEMRF
jgi:vitamin B12 transporter